MGKSLKSKNNPQKEAEKLQYNLRASFFYRKRLLFKKLTEAVEKIDGDELEWGSLEEFGISKVAWNHTKTNKIAPVNLFAHPEVIKKAPHLLAYYRMISGISQKGMARITFATAPYEEDQIKSIDERKLKSIIATINRHLGSLIESDPSFSLDDAKLLGMMNYGTQINGSWRNEIGSEGGRRVKEFIQNYFLKEKKLKQIHLKDGSIRSVEYQTEIDNISGFDMLNGYRIIFGSEPDVSILDPSDKLEAAIEIKAGVDPAGALERYGAAKKSFDKALRENKSAETIYLASCITEGVKKEMSHDRLVRRDFNLTDIFVDETIKQEFLQHLKWLMHL